MFICKECHDKTDCEALHSFRSHGLCEVCGKEADCYDCRPVKVSRAAERVVLYLQECGMLPDNGGIAKVVEGSEGIS